MYETEIKQAREAVCELCDIAKLKSGDIMVIGCSSSEISGGVVGHASNYEVAEAIFSAIYSELKSRGIFLAAQCCEHLNRAIIIEREAYKGNDEVNVVPQPKAGGSFATAAYRYFEDPIAVEHIKANAGLDIGGVLIGMHLKEVAVPVRLSVSKIGEANIIAARTRPKFIGGARAVYNEELL